MLDTQVRWLPVEQIAPNPHQPRREFAPGPLAELAESIRRHGIIQPLSVRRRDDGWELIAGERRLRAAKLAGLQTVPCLEMQVDKQDSAILALIENIQRRDLHYLEEAAAIAAYLRRSGATQEEAAARAKERAAEREAKRAAEEAAKTAAEESAKAAAQELAAENAAASAETAVPAAPAAVRRPPPPPPVSDRWHAKWAAMRQKTIDAGANQCYTLANHLCGRRTVTKE